MEADADHDGKFTIPDELRVASIMDRTGMSYQELLNTPHHVIEELEVLWWLQDVAREARQRKADGK